jgi:hypothetical protein
MAPASDGPEHTYTRRLSPRAFEPSRMARIAGGVKVDFLRHGFRRPMARSIPTQDAFHHKRLNFPREAKQ